MMQGLLLCLLIVTSVACSRAAEEDPQVRAAIQATAEQLLARYQNVPQGLFFQPPVPEDNPMTLEKVVLGYLLYFDPRLSIDGTVSCATCHDPSKGWTDQAPVSTGVKGQKGTRSAQTVLNSAYMMSQFWDGREPSLEAQALGPLINPIEMANESHEQVTLRLKQIKGYQPYFQKAFGEGPSKETISQAIAAFERTILSGNSRYDRYSQGDKTAMTESEVRGMKLFFGKALCTRCHVGPNFSDSLFHNLGVGMDKEVPDLGRYDATKLEADKGAFKTPTVRDITRTAPYMHDGSQETLEEVMEFYDKGGEKNPHLDVRVEPLNLTGQEEVDIIAYMKALDSEPYLDIKAPAKFP